MHAILTARPQRLRLPALEVSEHLAGARALKFLDRLFRPLYIRACQGAIWLHCLLFTTAGSRCYPRTPLVMMSTKAMWAAIGMCSLEASFAIHACCRLLAQCSCFVRSDRPAVPSGPVR